MPEFITDFRSFRYCPKCGSGDMRFHGKKLFCRACSFTYYINPALAVGALILDAQDRLLVVTRGNEPAKGSWDIPGGFADAGETAEQTLCREIQEELGVQVIAHTYFGTAPNIYPYKGVTYHTIDVVYRCRVDHPERIRPADDVAAAAFVQRSELEVHRFGMISIQQIIARFLET
jgi:ADP-ribose pyrophosphatase YjhB (NUDIX family)